MDKQSPRRKHLDNPATVPDPSVMDVREFAADLGVTPHTVRRWIRDGFTPVEPIRFGPHGQYRFSRQKVNEFLGKA